MRPRTMTRLGTSLTFAPLVLVGVLLSGCGGAPTYDRDDPLASMEAISAELSPEEQLEFIQAVGTLVGSGAFQALTRDGAGAGTGEGDALVEERLNRMHGMTAEEIIDFADEVREAEASP